MALKTGAGHPIRTSLRAAWEYAMVSGMCAIFMFTLGAVAALFVFYRFSHTWPVRLLGAAMLLWFLWVAYWAMRIKALHVAAFGMPEAKMAPRLKLLGLARLHAEATEDRVFFAVSSQTILIVLLAAVLWQPWWLCVAAMLMSFTCYRSIRRGWPGYALILGGSHQSSARAVTIVVQHVLAPLNTTNLLSMATHSELDDELYRTTSYRLKNEFVSWKAAVEIHAVFSKVVVLDMTHLSQGVLEEFDLMRGSDFWYKTIFLCPTDESRQVLEQFVREHPAALVVHNLEDLRSSLLRLRDRFPTPPTPDCEIARLINADTGAER